MWAKQARSVHCDVCAAASPCLPTEAREDSTEWDLQLGAASIRRLGPANVPGTQRGREQNQAICILLLKPAEDFPQD